MIGLTPDRRARATVPGVIRTLGLACALLTPALLHAQATDDELEIARLEGTPIGALPPIALPMPASRNHHYWGIRLQGGARDGRQGSDLAAFAAGVDFQYRGGSVFGVTAGYQKRDCRLAGPDCGGHTLFGGRARVNLMTGGPTIGALFRDYSATSTLGTEVGFGYAPDVIDGMNACTLDFGVPMSVAMGQRIRVATFITPGIVWDMNCGGAGGPTKPSYLTGIGVGLQQIRNRGFDVYFGIQKIFRSNTGYQLGVSVTYVRLP